MKKLRGADAASAPLFQSDSLHDHFYFGAIGKRESSSTPLPWGALITQPATTAVTDSAGFESGRAVSPLAYALGVVARLAP